MKIILRQTAVPVMEPETSQITFFLKIQRDRISFNLCAFTSALLFLAGIFQTPPESVIVFNLLVCFTLAALMLAARGALFWLISVFLVPYNPLAIVEFYPDIQSALNIISGAMILIFYAIIKYQIEKRL